MSSDEDTDTFKSRPYQDELLDVCIKKNTIIYLPTGAGKTYIAIMTIKHFAKDLMRPLRQGGKRSLFIVNTVVLARQQAEFLSQTTSFIVKCFTGDMNVDEWKKEKWRDEFDKSQVIVATCQIIVDIIRHGFLSIRDFNIIIFDECHHGRKDHPMHQLMQQFEHIPKLEQPRVIGLTGMLISASIKPEQVRSELETIETVFQSTISTIGSYDDFYNMLIYSTNPVEKNLPFDVNEPCKFVTDVLEIVNGAIDKVRNWKLDGTPRKYCPKTLTIMAPSKSKYIISMFKDFEYQLLDMGIFGGSLAILSVIVDFELKKRESESFTTRDLYRMAITLAEQISQKLDIIMQDSQNYILDFSTEKVKRFLQYVKQFFNSNRDRNEMKCIVFVQRRYTAKLLYHILKRYDSNLKSDFIVGVNNEITESVDFILSNKSKRCVLEKFKRNETNLIVASSVLEEGIDLQSCNLVIQYDVPLTFRSYVQSRGRARSKSSEYTIMLPKNEEHKFLKKLAIYREVEEELRSFLIGKTINRKLPIDSDINKELFDHIIPPYITKKNAKLDALNAICILNRYVQTLPKDSYTNNSLQWDRTEAEDLKIVTVTLPIQCSLKTPIRGDPFENLKLAKRSAAFKACVILHENGDLNDFLLPVDPTKKVEYCKNIYFNHWEKYSEDNNSTTGTKRNKRAHSIVFPKEFEECTPKIKQSCYLYFFKMEPKFVRTDKLGIQEVFFQLYNSSNSFGILTSKKLPSEIAKFFLYITMGQIDVEVISNPVKISTLSGEDIDLLKNFHRMIFRDLLKIRSRFLIHDNSNTENSYIIVPTINHTMINWPIVKQFQELRDPRELSEFERKRMKIDSNAYSFSIINPWYRFDNERNYLVTHVLEHQSPLSPFPNQQYDNYAAYYAEKYSKKIVNENQFLIQVSGITTILNRLIPGIDEMGRSKKICERNLQEIYIPELCHNFMFPGDIWIKAILLPSILHRLHYLLLAESIRVDMSTYLNVHQSSRQFSQLPVETNLPGEKLNKTLLNSLIDGCDDVDRDESASSEDECDDLVLKTKSIVIPNPVYVEPIKVNSHIESYFDKLGKEFANMGICDIDRDINNIHSIDLDHLIRLTKKYYEIAQSESNTLNQDDHNSYLLIGDTSFVSRAICDTKRNDKMEIQILDRHSVSGAAIFQQKDILKALTSLSSCDVFDQERFEVLGDAFLKFAISFFLYKKHPSWHEGHLTSLKGKIVSNRNLFYCGDKFNLGGMIKQYNFNPKIDFQPPLFSLPKNLEKFMHDNNMSANLLYHLDLESDEVEGKKEITDARLKEILDIFDKTKSTNTTPNNTTRLQSYIKQQYCSDKAVADTVESLLGVCLNTIGVERSFNFLTYFNILPKTEGDLRNIMSEHLQCACLKSDVRLEEIDDFLINYPIFEKKLGYTFNDRAYLLQALTHSSFSKNRLTDCYQKLEFLGDSVLDFLITTYIFERCTHMDPGKLTDLRSALVNNTTLACIAVRNKFHLHLLAHSPALTTTICKFAQYQEKMHHKVTDQVYLLVNETEDIENNIAENAVLADFIDVPKALGDIFESLVGAIFLDSNNNLKKVWNVIYNLMENELNDFLKDVPIQIIRRLYEFPGAIPKFSNPVVNGDVVMVTLRFTRKGEILSVSGFGQNKEDAKKAAAKIALQMLHEDID